MLYFFNSKILFTLFIYIFLKSPLFLLRAVHDVLISKAEEIAVEGSLVSVCIACGNSYQSTKEIIVKRTNRDYFKINFSELIREKVNTFIENAKMNQVIVAKNFHPI